MLNESRGQISVEIVLLVGLALIVTLAIAQYIGPSLEQDKVMSAARIGCIDASNDIAYNGTGNVIRFNNMSFSNGIIIVNIYSQKSLNSTNKNYIQSKMLNNIAQALDTTVVSNTVKGRYTYRINITNVT